MGVFQQAIEPLQERFQELGTGSQVGVSFVAFIFLAVVLNVLKQLFFSNPNEPPMFFKKMRAKHGDVYTFVLLGKKMTVCLGTKGNDFILNGKLRDVNAEEIYTVLTTPVFGRDVVYDCPNAKLMEQKKFMKGSLTTEAFRSYVPIITEEVNNYFRTTSTYKAKSGTMNVAKAMAEVTIFTASHSLQGKEIRDQFDESLADLYHDLDMGFTAINFILHWAPLPGTRSETTPSAPRLMNATYKNGIKIPDHEIAHMMIALLMAGQHSSSSTSSWIMLRLAQNPEIMEELYQEQVRALGKDLPPLQYEDLAKLPLNQAIIKETLRLHAPIHSIMRAVKSPMPVPGSKWVIPTSHTLLSAPGLSASDPQFFPSPDAWDPHRWEKDSPNAPTIVRQEAEEDDEKIDYGYGLVSKGAGSPYLPFGAGRHRCIGEHFANVQLQTLVANVVRTFKFKNVDGGKTIVGTDYQSLFSRPLEPCNIHWERRDEA
ncbi:unnamed protein product [Parascedosporium putredinis]|uniref:Eburicol 14-alpha-demethylase n=1 Tax=Parascedosporium putredinis TaxID=1442378 RepID=A0A9P1H7J4_9PEZI|nr:unnamed protein product [Parascedosporium putredinis]CAI7998554.1 unnamed protein product [Parascedosporium putredinis]